jgi:uncharacterized membrane protein
MQEGICTMPDQNQSLQLRIENLEKKIDHISKILNVNYSPLKEKEIPPPIPKIQSSPVLADKNTNQSTPVNLLPILAVICFGMAGVFIVKLAIESGWLTLERQWGLLVLFGFALVGVGLFLKMIDKSYRSYAGASGIIVLYLAAYSSFLYFNIFSVVVAQVLAIFVSFLCLYLFQYFESEMFVIISAIGTYISPIILGKESDLIFVSGFFLIWAALFSRISIYLRSRTLVLLASYLGLGVFAFLNLTVSNHDELLSVILVQSLQFVIYAGGVFYYSIKNKDPLSKTEAIAYLPILLFFYGTIYFFLNKYNSTLAPWISLGFASFIYFLHWQARNYFPNLESKNLVQSFFAVVLFHSGYVELIPAEGKRWLLPIFILIKFISEQKEDFKLIAPLLRFTFFIMSVIEFFNITFRLINETNLLNVVSAVATIGLGFFYYTKSYKNVKNNEGLFLCLLHTLCILALYRLAFDYGSLGVSTVWGLYSVAILTWGYLKKNSVLAKSSLLVLTVTCLKALVYDAAQTSSGVRIASLILTGAILYGAGFLFQKIKLWDLPTK